MTEPREERNGLLQIWNLESARKFRLFTWFEKILPSFLLTSRPYKCMDHILWALNLVSCSVSVTSLNKYFPINQSQNFLLGPMKCGEIAGHLQKFSSVVSSFKRNKWKPHKYIESRLPMSMSICSELFCHILNGCLRDPGSCLPDVITHYRLISSGSLIAPHFHKPNGHDNRPSIYTSPKRSTILICTHRCTIRF